MFGRCYKAELSKMLKGKGIYIAIAIILALIIMLGAFSNMLEFDNGKTDNKVDASSEIAMDDESIDIGDMNSMDVLYMLKEIPREQYDVVIGTLESKLALENENTNKDSIFTDRKANLKTQIAVLKYLKAHEEVNVNKLVVPSNMIFGITESSYNFLLFAMSIVTEIAIFYAVIMMSGVFAGEYKDGTLRMELLRPNSRNALLTAKWLAAFTMSAVLVVIGVIISVIYTAIKFEYGGNIVLCVVNNSSVFTINEHLFALMTLMLSLVSVFAVIQFSSFMCTISRYNRAVALAIPITVLIMDNFSAMLLQVMHLGIIDFAYNLDLSAFFIPMGASIPNSSLYTAIPILLTYIAIFMSVSYVKFNRVEV